MIIDLALYDDLFRLDSLSHINILGDYRDPSFNLVHAHSLILVGTLSMMCGMLGTSDCLWAVSGESNELPP